MLTAATGISLTAAVPRIGPANSGGPAFPAIGKSLMTKILLIEDDGETAEEVAAELAERGFDVEWSADGTAGLASARSSRPDVMIVDRMLSGNFRPPRTRRSPVSINRWRSSPPCCG